MSWRLPRPASYRLIGVTAAASTWLHDAVRGQLTLPMAHHRMTPMRGKVASWQRKDDELFLLAWADLSTWGGDGVLSPEGRRFRFVFERTDVRRRGRYLGGSCHLDQLLEPAEFRPFIDLQRAVIQSLDPPNPQVLTALDADSRLAYRRMFDPDAEPPETPSFWMRVATAEHARAWCRLLEPLLDTVLERAGRLDAGQVLLGRQLDLDSDPIIPIDN